jgi:hypothetical protein
MPCIQTAHGEVMKKPTTAQIVTWMHLIGMVAESSKAILSHPIGPQALGAVALANSVLEKMNSPLRITIVEKKK